MLLSWVVFPILLTLLFGGWGLLCRVEGALTIPVGFAAVVVVAGLLTAWPAVARATTTVIALGAAAGLALHVIRRRIAPPDPWAVAAAVALLFAFGAPVILSGEATFTGYLRLDDTGTFLGIVDRVLSHGRSLATLPPSTYALNLHAYIATGGYPIGSLTPLAVGRALVGVDAAWVYQPFLAYCGVMVGLVVYAIARPLSGPKRALIALFAAQSALLYGYALWGGVKELVAAVLVATLGSLVPPALAGAAAGPARRAARRPDALRVALVSAALADTLGPGGAAWVVPAVAAPSVWWLWRARRQRTALKAAVVDTVLLAGGAGALMLPMWVEFSAFLAHNSQLFGNSGAGGTGEGGLVSLYHPLSVVQLGGVWPAGDFRVTASAARVAPFLVAVAAGLVAAVFCRAYRRHPAVAAYPMLALLGALIVWLTGSNPWVVAKGLAIASPALPAAALIGASALGGVAAPALLGRPVVIGLTAAIGAGVIWSNVLGYRDATLAPKGQLAELQHIGPLVAHHGPTFVNEFEIYADRHFLRDGAPTEPAEYRPYQLPLADGTLLTQSAQADLDAFPASLLEGFGSIVTRTSPVASRPPSAYALVWRGRYYELWQRPATPATILEHVPFGDVSSHPYCGNSVGGSAPLCAIQPVAAAPCRLIGSLARRAAADHAQLVAYQRPAPLVARADQSRWPGEWFRDPRDESLTPTAPGALTTHIATVGLQRYAVWLGGSFARGFDVTVDGHDLGRVKNQLQNIGQYIEVGSQVLGPGVHAIVLRYPGADLTPGSGAEMTELDEIALQPLDRPATGLLRVARRGRGHYAAARLIGSNWSAKPPRAWAGRGRNVDPTAAAGRAGSFRWPIAHTEPAGGGKSPPGSTRSPP